LNRAINVLFIPNIQIDINILKKLLHSGEPQIIESELPRKDGTLMPIELFMHITDNTEGRPIINVFVNNIMGYGF